MSLKYHNTVKLIVIHTSLALLRFIFDINPKLHLLLPLCRKCTHFPVESYVRILGTLCALQVCFCTNKSFKARSKLSRASPQAYLRLAPVGYWGTVIPLSYQAWLQPVTQQKAFSRFKVILLSSTNMGHGATQQHSIKWSFDKNNTSNRQHNNKTA